MRAAPVAEHINQMPWETWVCADEATDHMAGLTAEDAQRVLHAGRRLGTVTVRRTGDKVEYKRVRRHPLPQERRVRATV